MKYRVNTRYEQLSLAIDAESVRPTKVYIKVYDEDGPKRVFTDRYKTINGREKFLIRMPLSPKNAVIEIMDESEKQTGRPSDIFRLTKLDKVPLKKRMDRLDINSVSVASFVDFAQRFSFNASYLETGKSYRSQDGRFLIEYVPDIIGNDGRRLNTPARISKQTGRIQVSKLKFEQYTIPMRMAILLHEFSHYYLNDNIDNESEADINALLVYLSLGYPRIEAYQAFLEVFKNSPSAQNKQRYELINNYISNFENQKMVMY